MKISFFILFAIIITGLNFISPELKSQSSQIQQNPASYYLGQNFPNPFNPSTTINYTLAEHGLVTIKVYNLIGKEMTTLVNEEKPAGNYSVKFDGSSLSSGVYFYIMKAGDFTQTRKFILMK
ncbi:MAG TPA: T9SS type A sorting domain-containing protein [Ignavibacteriaceae bacterium]|nr:T9SS type A sorting domain-containing protein [Ignavibacteriaceae bacterium]